MELAIQTPRHILAGRVWRAAPTGAAQ